ncbi:MAG: alpha/beta fold hydrolase [bacterium]|nr:alpha/beta fold hydrolase [bacterium]
MILLHGYGASGAVHRDDARALVTADTEVLLPDAPGHGERQDGRLTELDALDPSSRRAAILGIAQQHAEEVLDLADHRRSRGIDRVGLVGISMGGFAALATLRPPSPFAAVAALLTGTDLVAPDTITPGRPPLLLGLAGRDENVDPAPGRAFAAAYGAELHVYPESGHMMRAADWHDLWGRTAQFLARQLG